MTSVPTNGNGASRIGLWLSIAASAILVFASICSIAYVGFKVQSTGDALESLSRKWEHIDERVTVLQDRLTKIEVAQNEIETQFCAQDIVRNLMHANDLRNLSIIWEKQFGNPYPLGNTYYPTICNRTVK